jgi:hypothetical protein
MANAYLLTRPEHDDTTYYLSKWAEDTAVFARQKQIRVIDLNRERANKAEVESILERVSPQFVVFNGHGDERCVTGHNNTPMVEAGVNEQLLKSKIVYAISCSSAKELGKKSVRKGAANYTGYDDDFIFLYEPQKFSKPLQDDTAKQFLEPSRLFIKSILKGNTVKEARSKTENLLKRNIRKMLANNTGDASLVRYLWWDLKHFVSHGDPEASLL